MGALDQLTPGQRQALLFGAPIVAALGLGSLLGKRRAAGDEPPAPDGAVGPLPMPDTVALGDLAAFETTVTESLYRFGQRLDELEQPEEDAPAPVPKPSPTLSERVDVVRFREGRAVGGHYNIPRAKGERILASYSQPVSRAAGYVSMIFPSGQGPRV